MQNIFAFVNGLESAYLYMGLIIITLINLILCINSLNIVKQHPSKLPNYEIEKKRFLIYVFSVVVFYPSLNWFRMTGICVNVVILFYIMIYLFNGIYVLRNIKNNKRKISI